MTITVSNQQQTTDRSHLDGRQERGFKNRQLFILLAFIAGLAVGMIVFGWWLTPVSFKGATLEQLDKQYQKAFLIALTDLYYQERDLDGIRTALANWPEADEAICQVAAETEDEALAVRITALATELNGEGCMRVAFSQFDNLSENDRQWDSGSLLLITGLVLLLFVDGLAINRIWRHLAVLRREEAAAAAMAGVIDNGTDIGVIGRVIRAPFTLFVVRRLLAIPVTLIIITAVIYGMIMFAEPAERASLYLPPRTPSYLTPERMEQVINQIVEEHGLDDPYPQQYLRWLGNILRGNWGWSPALEGDVLPALLRRTPVTVELALYTLLFFIPLGLISGMLAGWRENSTSDHRFRLTAFIATSIPPFVLGLFLLSIFYVGLGWFPPGRTGIVNISLNSSTFTPYTGLLTIDGLLNGRFDVTFDAFRHLILPVFVLSLFHWATLGRITRTAIIEVKDQDYITAARARGINSRSLLWRHGFRNAMGPGLTSSALSVASLITGVFIIEAIFGLHGLSELVLLGMQRTPDAALALGFAVYTVLLVLPIMFILDIVNAATDPLLHKDAETT